MDLVNITGGAPLFIIFGFIIMALLASYVASRYRVANANEALIVAGSRGAKVRNEKGEVVAASLDDKGIKVVVGGGTFVLPLLHKVGRLRLTARQISVALNDAVTSQGIKVTVQGVATFKIGRDVESIRNAAERFLDSRDEQIDSIVKNVLEGSLRAIVGTLTIEELIMDRQKLLQQVQDNAKGDLATSGLQIDAFTIQSIADESGYVDLLGKQKLSLVERDARMAKATTDQEAAVREAEAEQVKISAQRDVALRRAETATQTAAAEARAAQSGPLAQAEAQQEVTKRQTELAQLEAARREQELIATTIRPAEAEATASIRKADGDRQSRIAAAQADAERVRLAGEAEAKVTFMRGEAQAKVVSLNADAEAHRTQVEGNAEAGITFNKGEAEAKALALRADAYKQFNEAAVIQTVLGMLPEIVRAAAEPMSHIGSLTVLSSDGASDLVRTTTRTIAEAGAAVHSLTGLDVPGLISNAMGNRGNGGNGGTATATRPAAHTEHHELPHVPDVPHIDPGQAMADASDKIKKSTQAATTAASTAASTAAATAAAAASSAAKAGAGQVVPAIELVENMTVDDIAKAAAHALKNVPEIEKAANLKLTELDSHGPAIAQAVWTRVGPSLTAHYGSLTVRELLDRFGGS